LIFVGEQLEHELCGLTTKKSRNKWEKMFTACYITPLLQVRSFILPQVKGA